jgi:hypothetical protein
MPAWKFQETCDLVERRFGKPNREAAHDSIQSVVKRLDYARFHYQEVGDMLAEFKASHLDERSVFGMAFGPHREARDAYEQFMDAVGAHAIACLQSVHAIADLLANAIFYSLRLDADGKPLRPEQVDFKRVSYLLEMPKSRLPIKAAIDAMVADASYVHVDALSNKAKHSSLVDKTLTEDLAGERPDRHEIRFRVFVRKGVEYRERKFEDVLRPAYAIASSTVVEVGHMVDAEL